MSDENILNDTNGQEMPSGVKIIEEKGLGYTLTVEREDLFKAASALKEAGFDLFMFVSGIDYPDSIKLTYRVYSTKKSNKIAVMLKTEVPKSDPVVDSLVPLWSSANWHERETYDLYGVIFRNHPDLRRIFMPDDWVGHPLRKDYSDSHMLVMDDGKKDKEAAKDKAKVAKDKSAALKEKAEKPEPKASEASNAGTEQTSTETTEKSTTEPVKTETPKAENAGSSSAQESEVSMDGSGGNE